jgi:group II intron reverse transcriptase/maturase
MVVVGGVTTTHGDWESQSQGEAWQVNQLQQKEGKRMLDKIQPTLEALEKFGRKGTPLTRIYPKLYKRELYIGAYNKIYSNDGAMTEGVDPTDTIDGMNLRLIDGITAKMRREQYRFKGTRKAKIPKAKGGFRTISLPTFSDKMVQECIRVLLESYYEPQFSAHSHGFRPNRGCHTALEEVKREFSGVKWFIEGDIKGCFDNINHDLLMEILARNIKDGRLLGLIRKMLVKGAAKEWYDGRSYSGTPQGGVLSPLLANIYLNELDQYMERVLLPKWNYGKRRKENQTYRQLRTARARALRNGKMEEAAAYLKEMQRLPSQDPNDPDFRRLKYVRYADDFILGFVGTKAEATKIKEEIKQFLAEHLKLQLSDEKTLITHASTRKARFLGYDIIISHCDAKMTRNSLGHKKRSVNGLVRLEIPREKISGYKREYLSKGRGKPCNRLLEHSVFHILDEYQTRFRGIVNYYQYAANLADLSSVKHTMEWSLTATLSKKLRISIRKVYRRFQGVQWVNGKTYKVLRDVIQTRNGEKSRIWGGISLSYRRKIDRPIVDVKPLEKWVRPTDLVKRLLADKCEMCGKTGNCEVHHVKKLSDLKNKWKGRRDKPLWVKNMIAIHRKTLVVCQECHENIHKR